MSEILKDILCIIRQNITQDLPDEELDLNESLLVYGVDSLNFAKIVVEIENMYGFEFEDDDLNLYVFPDLQSLVDYVEVKSSNGEKT